MDVTNAQVYSPDLPALEAIYSPSCHAGRLVNYEYNSITTKSYIWQRYAIVEHK
jgi:hypothetical protein